MAENTEPKYMTIGEFARRYTDRFNREKAALWWIKEVVANGSWMKCLVNYYTLLCDVPLWEFNQRYNEWYARKDKEHEAGPMGDFLSDEPTVAEIEEFMNLA